MRSDDDKDAALLALHKAGFTPKRLDMVRRKRMARCEVELYAQDAVDRQPHWSETVAPDSPEMQALRKARADNPLMNARAEK